MIALPSPRNARLQTLQRQALRETLCVAPAYAALAVALGSFADFGAAYVFKAAALFAGASWLLWQTIGAHAPHTRFGAANRVTLLRLALVLLIAAAAGESVAAPHLAWGVVGLATSAALLDAMDGPLARASGLASEFGARFDMETDALLVLTLSVLAWQFDRAGAWVFAAGLIALHRSSPRRRLGPSALGVGTPARPRAFGARPCAWRRS